MTRAGREVTTMKTATITPKLAIALCAAAGLFLSLAFAAPAAAWIDSGWGYYDSDWGWDDGEDQAWAEESAREAGREKRREEVEQKKAADSAYREEYVAEIMSASKASLNAPKDVFYRKPGWKSNDAPPPTAQTVTADVKGGQIAIIYDQGIFWLPRGSEYVVVVPPLGVVVDKLPPGVRGQPTKDQGVIYYFFGTFFKAKGDKYEVIKPPTGTFVGYLPDGYVQEGEEADPTFKFGPISYKQVFVAGQIAYQVI